MRKLFHLMAIIISSTLLSDAYAEKPPPNAPTFQGVTIPNPASSGQVMSNDAFKGTVNKLGAETTKNLDQTVQQQIKSSSASSPPPAPSSSTSSDTSAPSTSKPTQPNQPTDSTNTESEDESTGLTPTAQSSGVNRPANQAPAQPSDQPSSSSSQPYTGFGGGQTNQNSKSSGSNQDGKSGGWNVGY